MQFFNLIAVFGLAAFAAAAPQQEGEASSVTSMAPTSTAPGSPTTSCLATCETDDICCQAACVGVPCPDEGQVNATTECAMACEQGDGSPEDTEAYANCQSSCISSLFLTSTNVASATGTNSRAPSNSASATASSSNSEETSGSSAASSSASAAAASSIGNAANTIQVGASTAGLLGLLMAALVL